MSVVAVAVLAVAAVVLTGVGVAQSDAWTGERTYRFTTATVALAPQGPTSVGAAPARFDWPAPVNATALHVNATVTFTGQAVQGGTAIVRLVIVAPDGHALPPVTRSLAVAAGASTATLTFEHAATWAMTPHTVRDARVPDGLPWTGPVSVLVSVDRPSDLPVANYSFTAAVAAEATTFAA